MFKFLFYRSKPKKVKHILYIYIQWRNQKFRLGGARLKDKIGSKKLI